MPKKGEKMSPEQKAKISIAMRKKGAEHTAPARAAMAAYRDMAHRTYQLKLKLVEAGHETEDVGSGKYYQHSDATKAKISASLKAIGHKPNAEARKKLAVYNKIRKDTTRLREILKQMGLQIVRE